MKVVDWTVRNFGMRKPESRDKVEVISKLRSVHVSTVPFEWLDAASLIAEIEEKCLSLRSKLLFALGAVQLRIASDDVYYLRGLWSHWRYWAPPNIGDPG